MEPENSSPKTTRPVAEEQREQPQKVTSAERIHRKLDAFPDKVDIRDWFYQPPLTALPDQVINCDRAHLILDQGIEGACTGFALAAVINYHLVANGRCTSQKISESCASPRMLYEMARRYDEWPGEEYDGSSARGTMKGWSAHGVVNRSIWPDDLLGPGNLDVWRAKEALNIPSGAFYRVLHRQVRDMHAALNESGILYATLMVHQGWNNPQETIKYYTYYREGKAFEIELPIIERKGRADSGHAVAIIGYTREGFIIQNSWGTGWGKNGFALLPYEDWMLHASDCWVVQLGVPVEVNLWQLGMADTTAGLQRASRTVPLEQIRPYVINIGNNGHLSDNGEYWTTREDIDRLFESAGKAAENWQKKRIMLYLHGGLNSEREVASRIIAFKEVCLANEIYPVHIMWETDFWTSLKNDLLDVFTTDDTRAGAGWLAKLREGTKEILDRTFELTASKPGTMLWDEMKENAKLASSSGRAMDIIAHAALTALNGLDQDDKEKWELHIVGHSAGCIFTAYALDTLLKLQVPIKSIQLMAPAISIDLFKRRLLPQIKTGKCPLPTLYILSDVGERDDTVGPYGKSLLYLISNSFERKREVPILGMERFINSNNPELDLSLIDPVISRLYNNPGQPNSWPSLIISGQAAADIKKGPNVSRSESHGGFDNDDYTLNSVLYRILGEEPKRPFTIRELQF
jgi:hypothetical protein